MFAFYNHKKLTNFLNAYSLIESFLKNENNSYIVAIDFILSDEEIELGYLKIQIQNKQTLEIVYQNYIYITKEIAYKSIEKLQKEFISTHKVELPFFTRDDSGKFIAHHIKSEKLELILKLHSEEEKNNAFQIQNMALKKRGENQIDIRKNTLSQEEKAKKIVKLMELLLENYNDKNVLTKAYLSFQKPENIFTIWLKDEKKQTHFHYTFPSDEVMSRSITNQVRNDFIENHVIFLPSIQKESDSRYAHHLKNTNFELIIPMNNRLDEKDTYEAQKKALEKISFHQDGLENKRIHLIR